MTSQTTASGFAPPVVTLASCVGGLAEPALVEVAERRPSRPPRPQRLAVAKPMPVPAAAVTTTALPASRPWAGGYSGGVAPLTAVTFGSGGRPSARSPMMLRWIWFEPP